MVIAGEISGDMHAARLIRAIREKEPDVTFWGIGGERMHECGVDLAYDVDAMGVMGLSDVLQKYGFFKRVFNEMREEARRRKPDAVLLVDYPGFNLRFAEVAHRMGLKVIYYVCPQVWAWHRSRIGKMARIVDRLLVIFPFEVDVFRGTDLKVDFVGHPLVEKVADVDAGAELPWHSNLRVALLPGSRRHEVERILPVMWQAAGRIQHDRPDASFLIAAASETIAEVIDEVLSSTPDGPMHWNVVIGETRACLAQARAGMVASGTATIEAALMGCPMAIVYKTSWLTYLLGRMVVKVPHIGMVNIVAGRPLCPEFIQGEAKPDAVAQALEPLLHDGPAYDAMKTGLSEVREALAHDRGADHAAEIVLGELL
jgi:lipid-A-disaccharide synthase